ncbi:MAG: hypothetical protein HY074_02300 [Deltaproteobacteria bacterium]|nr:hypothetical protein [Deltaproteobacteria bacterium]
MNQKVNARKVLAVGITTGMLFAVGARADHCTTPPTSIDAAVSSSASYDANNKLYTYSYKLQNSKTSMLSIERFIVPTYSNPNSSTTPANWWGRYMDEGWPRMNWSTYLSHPPGVKAPAPTTSGYRPKYFALKPGDSLNGFSFQSPNPPGVGMFFVEGDTPPPTSTPTATDDEPEPNCPGWVTSGGKLENMVTGMTQAPAAPNTISVVIRMRSSDGNSGVGPFDPARPGANVTVIVQSSKTFDAATVDVSSIKFGPGKAVPISSKLVPSNGQSSDSEAEDWEKSASPGKAGDQAKNLFLSFDARSIGVRCIDHALFLTGKTTNGKAIIGGKQIILNGCKITANK